MDETSAEVNIGEFRMNKFQKLIHKYLRGNCTPSEIEVVNDWYDSFEHGPDPLDAMPEEKKRLLKQRLLSKIKTNTGLNEPVRPRKPVVRKLVYAISAVAAAFVIVTSIVFVQSNHAVPTFSHSVKIVVNNTCSIQKILLKDGSIVWLNPESRIEFPEKFAISQRAVRLNGEAFFEVTPDKNRPFIITSGNVVTRVWGTSFRIRAVKKMPVEVSVVTGKVSVRLDEDRPSEIMLLPNEKATYLSQTHTLKKERETKSSAMRIWQKTTMSFDNAPVRDVIQSLNNSFGVRIRSDDEQLLSFVLKADFTDQSLPAILEMLEKSLDISYSIQNREIILTANY